MLHLTSHSQFITIFQWDSFSSDSYLVSRFTCFHVHCMSSCRLCKATFWAACPVQKGAILIRVKSGVAVVWIKQTSQPRLRQMGGWRTWMSGCTVRGVWLSFPDQSYFALGKFWGKKTFCHRFSENCQLLPASFSNSEKWTPLSF